MLQNLSIRDVVLIDRVDLGFEAGLGVLTGETGSGKSILLDALGLAIGMRAEAGLVRPGAEKISVSAEFHISADHPAMAVLKKNDLDGDGGVDGGLILRRVVGADGRSRAYINDQSVSVAMLRQVGETLIEVQGQFEAHGLLDPASHIGFVDAFGGHEADLDDLAAAYRAWRGAEAALDAARQEMARAKRDEEYLRHGVGELDRIDPKPGEEDRLARLRALMMHGEKINEAVAVAVSELGGEAEVETAIRAARKVLESVKDKAQGQFEAALAALERAAIETAEAAAELDRLLAGADADPEELERVEERLFELRALARKYNIDVDGLAAERESMRARLAAIEDGAATVKGLTEDAARALGIYEAGAGKLTAARERAGARLDKAVMKEFPALNLGDVVIKTRIYGLDEAAWGAAGRDRVEFEIATNPGGRPGPLHRVASGGELARIMLALKVVLAGADPVSTIIFDEVDSGLGGATAAAVGERLEKLAREVQVLVVTHSPQVAALGAFHWRVSKSATKDGNRTRVDVLDAEGRREEIARMLAGRKVTDEARAAAAILLAGGKAREAAT